MKKIALGIATQVIEANKAKRMKVRTLMKRFGFQKRTNESASKITQELSELEIYLNPSIMKIGGLWKLSLDDRVTLSHEQQKEFKSSEKKLVKNFKHDVWFENLAEREFRTEREVETKFILPLLDRLGYSEDDRFDGMCFKAFHGSRSTILETDCSLFASDNEILDNQVLLVVEAKREDRLVTEVELIKAQKQTKSYAIWLSCHFGLISDGRKIQVLDLFPNIGGMNVLFDCKIGDLKSRFSELYNHISKEKLVEYYENLII